MKHVSDPLGNPGKSILHISAGAGPARVRPAGQGLRAGAVRKGGLDGVFGDFQFAPTMTDVRGAIFKVATGRLKWAPWKFQGVVSEHFNPI